MSRNDVQPFSERIERIPREMRVLMLWAAVFLSSIILVLLWIMQLRVDLVRIDGAAPRKEKQLLEGDDAKNLRRQLPSLWSSMKGTLSGILSSDMFEGSATTTPEGEESRIQFQDKTRVNEETESDTSTNSVLPLSESSDEMDGAD